MFALLRGADGGDDARVGLAHDDRVDDPGERQRVRERERPAREDERMARVALATSGRNARRVQHADEPGDLELVGDAEGEDGELLDGAQRLVGDRMLRLARRVALALVVEKGPLAGEAGRLHERAVDALVAEGAHPDAVGRRVAERDRERRLLCDPPDLVGQAVPNSLVQGGGRHSVIVLFIPDFQVRRKKGPCSARAPGVLGAELRVLAPVERSRSRGRAAIHAKSRMMVAVVAVYMRRPEVIAPRMGTT